MTDHGGSTLERIWDRLAVRLRAYASFKGVRNDADDVVQETRLVLLSKYSQIESEADLVPLAFRVCHLKVMEFLRAQRKTGDVLPDDAQIVDPQPDALGLIELSRAAGERDEQVARLLRAIAGMSEPCRTLFQLRLSGHTTAQIIQRLKIRPGTLHVREHRCRRGLLAKLS